jgi:hypothetical protein
MKKLILSLMMICTVAIWAQYSPYSGEWTEGNKKYCRYLDGTVITVSAYRSCPMSIE